MTGMWPHCERGCSMDMAQTMPVITGPKENVTDVCM